MTVTKPPIVFVHGAWHGAWCWEKYFVPYFSKQGYPCITFDLPKHGSPGLQKGINFLSMQHYVDALKREIQQLTSPPILMGHSMGGMIIQKYLETATCAMAVLLAPAPPSGVLPTTLRFLKKRYTLPSLLLLNLFHLVNSPAKTKWAFFSNSISNEELLEYSNQMCAESYRAFLDMLVPMVKVKFHAHIPMLVLAAEDDRVFSVAQNRITAKKYNADFEIISHIAHDMMLDHNHEKVANFIENWLTMKLK